MRKLPYRLAILIAVLLLLGVGGARYAPAQEGLGLGQVTVTPYAGYGGYALPVANSALARDWAADDGLAWQVGMNYSTIPVFVDIEHRQPMARRVRITVTSPHGYAQDELATAGQAAGAVPLSVPETSVSQEVLVPPSVPVSIALLPRACPPSRPGSIQRLSVRIEIEGLQQPLTKDVEVIQLEPAHLYSLYLDGPQGQFFKDLVNEDNHLGLQLPQMASDSDRQIVTDILSSRHYTMGIPRREMTMAPLAARDFAFVVAALDEVRNWPDEEQQELLTFMLGGGRLCLFNAAGRWQGLDLSRDALPVGRGYLLPVAGDFSAARRATTSMLEGELSEFTLWCRGSVGGWHAELLGRTGDLTEQLDLRELLGLGKGDGIIASHRPGFMHPLWIYRETCFNGALEAWNYPEFTAADLAVIANNRNFRGLIAGNSSPESIEPLPFMLDVEEARAWPRALGWIALALPLVMLANGMRLRFRWPAVAAAVIVLGSAAVAWWMAQPQQSPPLRTMLFDVEQELPQALARELIAAQTGQQADIRLRLESGALVRRVSWQPAGEWSINTEDGACQWTGTGGGKMVSVFSEAHADPPRLPVSVHCERSDEENLRLTIDTSGLAGDEECYLLTALGWLVLPGGQKAQMVYLTLPSISDWPGAPRIRAWEERLQQWIPTDGRFGTIINARNLALLQQLNRVSLPDEEMIQPRETADFAQDPLRRARADQLIRMGLVQNPTVMRGMLRRQGVIFSPLHPDDVSSGDGQTMNYLRMTFSLEPPP